MGLQSLLEQVLSSAAGATGSSREDMGKYATGAAVGGVLGLLLGTGRGRRLGGTAIKVGSIAALGALAWKTYQEHQARQAVAPAAAPSAPPVPTPLEALPAPQAEARSRALLKAVIAAAKSDGHVDAAEAGRIQEALQRLGADEATRRWVQDELARPIDPAEVAALAEGPEMASEMYLASVIMVDTTSTMERAYLDELARQLRLDGALKADLEARAVTA